MGQSMRARGHRAANVGTNEICSPSRGDRLSRAVARWVESLEPRRLFASIATDKDDYAFGETAQITGTEFQAGETVQLQVTHVEGTPGSNADAQNQAWQVQADAAGNITGTWVVNDPDATGATYLLTATGTASGEIATTTFTDSRTINSVTLNGGTTVTVAPGASITAAVNVTTDNGGGNQNWRSTGWRIATTPPGTLTIVDHANHDGSGTYDESFSITAPIAPGTYNAYFIAYSNDGGTAQPSVTFTLLNAVTVAAPNVAPVITLPGGPLNYIENDPATIIDAGATATDTDSANFAGGTLTVDYTANGSADDRLAIRNQGTGAGQIGVSGSNVTFGGTTIGTFTGGTGTTPLVVTFNASSSPTAAQALMRNITFANVSDTPSTAARTVRFVLTDGDGGTSNAATKTINVAAVNDVPSVAADNATVTVNEGSPASNTGTYSDVDGGNVAISASVGTVTKTGTTSGTWSWSYTPGDGPDASQTVTITANDGNGGVTTTTFSLTVNNVAPAVTAAANQSANEGQNKSFNLGSFTDPAGTSDQPYAVNVDWGDGSTDTTFTAASPGSLAAQNHTYADNGNYTVTLSVTEDNGTGATGTATFTVAVANVAPTIAISGGAPSVSEGSAFSLTLGAVTDPGTDTVSQYVVHWGDGNSDTYTSNGVKTHTYADGPNAYAITVDLVDEDGTHTDRANPLGVTVDNVAPTIAISGDATIDEGSPYTLNLRAVTDPGADTVTSYVVHWGDGNSNTYTSDGHVTHTYADGPNSYSVTVDLADEDGTYLNRANAHSVSVLNVAPVVTAPANQSADEGENKSFSLGSFTDPADASDQPYAVSMDWGDGSSLTTFSVANPGSLGSQPHTYADNGSYTVTVTVTEEGGTGASDSASFTANVANVAPTLTLSGAASVNEAALYTLNLSSSDPGTDTITSWTINWGDGNTEVVTGNPSSVTHTYADDEPGAADDVFTISATATDEDGTYAAENTLAVTVVNLNPTIGDVANDGPVDEGSPVSVTITATDPAGANDPLKYSFDFNNDGDFTDAGDVLDSSSNAASFTFADDGSFTVGVRVTDGDGGSATSSTTVTVNNVAPTIAISGDANVDEGSAYTLTLGAVTDPGDDTVTSYIVYWGDGDSDTYTSGGNVTHTYTDGPATYDITVDLVDEDGTFLDAANDLSVTVDNVAPTIAITGGASVNEGSSYSLTLGAVTDPGDDTVSSYIVDWGDGNSDTYSANGVVTHTYADGPNIYNITVDLVDDDGTHTDTANAHSVTVNNVEPTIAISGAANVSEGSSYSLTLGAVTDPGVDTVTSYVVHWGDGSSDTYGSNGVKTHTYADGPNSYAITVDLVDEDGTYLDQANALSVTVDNVDPTIAISGDANVDEGSSYSLTVGAVTDPGDDTVTSYVVHWGDGNSDTYTSIGVKTHTYADGPNSYDITLDLVDEDGTYLDQANAHSVTVDNVSPTIAISGDATVDEGSAYTLNLGAITDPGSDTVTSYIVHWGDGNSDTYTAGGDVTHTYADGPNTYDITVDLVDEDGTHLDAANALQVEVENVAPTVAANNATVTVDEADTALNSGTYADPGDDTITLWASVGTIIDNLDGTWSWSFGTTDGPEDGQTVTIRATDSDGEFTETTFELVINNVAPTLAISGNANVDEAATYTLGLSSSDPGSDTIASWTINWGDGNVETVTGNPLSATHTYADGPANYTISATATDEDGTFAAGNTVAITVKNVNPTARANSYSLNEDGSVSGNVITDGTADSDPAGANDPLTVSAVNGSASGVGTAVGTAHGTVTVNANGTFTYTPNANFFGTDSFTYTISDGDGGTSTATVTLTVNEVNDAPDAVNDSALTLQDTAVSGNVLTNDTDPDNTDGITGNEDTLTVTGHTEPAHGTLVINANGTYTYTPDLGYSGADSFTYTISDGTDTDTATVNVNVGAAASLSTYLRNDDCFGGQMLIVNGSSAADNIQISPTNGGAIEVFVNGVNKGTFTFSGRIIVFGYGGDDQITIAGAVPNAPWVYGDDGNDMLNLGNGGGIAWGGNGNDHINGGSGTDILVGGQGADRIVGNPGDDILAAGYTKYDDRFSATSSHEDAWCHLYHEWSRTDLTTTSVAGDSSYTAFEKRIDHLMGTTAGGYNGTYRLNNSTVEDDDAYDQIDMLTGSAGEDWFLWTKGEDKVNGMSSTEGAEDLDYIS